MVDCRKIRHNIFGFGSQFTKMDSDYFRIYEEHREWIDDLDRQLTEPMILEHGQGMIALCDNFENKLLYAHWGARPQWWKERVEYMGLSLFFVRAAALKHPFYQGATFYLVPVRSVVGKKGSRHLFIRPQARFFWLIGVGWRESLTPSFALIRNAGNNLIDIPEHIVRKHYRGKNVAHGFNSLIRFGLKDYLSKERLDIILPERKPNSASRNAKGREVKKQEVKKSAS